MSDIIIRNYKKTDAPYLAAIYYNTIHNINIKDYNQKQINAWAPSNLLEDYNGWQEKIERIKPFIALIDNKIVGFAEFEESGYIDCFYVHHEYQNKKIGTNLMKAIFDKALKENISRIFANVSITARPFFQFHGFHIVKQQIVTLRGVELSNFVMEKNIMDHKKLIIQQCVSKEEWRSVKDLRNTYFFNNIEDSYVWTFNHKDHLHYILIQESEIIGYIHIQLWPDKRAALRIIVITQNKQKQGFGRYFLCQIEKELKKSGIKSLHVQSTPQVLDFYKFIGYQYMQFNDPDNYENSPDDIDIGKIL